MEQKIFEVQLQEQLDKLPYEKHADDGLYNDGQLDGFELGARWLYDLLYKDGSELDSLDAPAKSNDAYSIVGGSHACGADQSGDSGHTSDETLGKIIDSESNCENCKFSRRLMGLQPCLDCWDFDKHEAITKES